MQKYNVKIICLCCEQNNPKPNNMAAKHGIIAERSMKYFRNVIDLASKISVEKILVTSGWSYYNEDLDEAFRRSVKNMKQICDYAKSKSIKLCIEPLQPQESRIVNNIESMKRYIKQVNKSNLEIALDLVALAKSNETIQEWFECFKDKIVHCHFVDGSPTGHLSWSRGTRNLEDDLSVFIQNQFKGDLSFEFANSVCFLDPKEEDKQSLDLIKKVLERQYIL